MMTYTTRTELKPSGLNGISEEQIVQHWGLYEGYIAQSNALKKDLETMLANGEGGTAGYADRRRRYGFEFNGMVLHEYYFGNLKAGVACDENGGFAQAVAKRWGSFEAWKEDFTNTGKSRRIGWAICAMDPSTGDINNHFIQLHEEGNVPGFQPLLVMDVWEHAYMVDHKASGRPDYINAFWSNVNWDVVECRYACAEKGEQCPRFDFDKCCAA
jgi:Fe-Mn family superoxide dismutase